MHTIIRSTIRHPLNSSIIIISLAVGMAYMNLIAILILTVALFYYLGLINNKLIAKTKEHAIRCLNGAAKTNLTISFMYETAFQVRIALLTVSFQSWKTATRNPVEAQRYE